MPNRSCVSTQNKKDKLSKNGKVEKDKLRYNTLCTACIALQLELKFQICNLCNKGFTTKNTPFNVIKFKAVFKNRGRKISSGIIEIK